MKHILDKIAAIRTNPNAFEEWSDYRRQLTDIVIAGTSKGDTLAVYGAGSCNDIDLRRLAKHFSEITLLDLNEEAMKDAVSRHRLEESEKIRIECFDFVGISEPDSTASSTRRRSACGGSCVRNRESKQTLCMIRSRQCCTNIRIQSS